MDRVWVVTSGRILSGAENSVYDHLSKRNLSKVVHFISGEHLVPLIDEHYPTYWHDSLEPVDVVREQKSRLVQFLRRLLVALGGSQPEVEVTINQLINSHFPPTVTIPPDKSLSRLSSYAVEIESIDSDYAHEFFTGECGSVQKGFFKAKEAIYYAMFDVDNSVYEYEKVIKTTNPEDLIAGFHDNHWTTSTMCLPQPFPHHQLTDRLHA
jgi:uncharacterized protein (DUF2164 family)